MGAPPNKEDIPLCGELESKALELDFEGDTDVADLLRRASEALLDAKYSAWEYAMGEDV